jgi:hypothetical protein
MAFRIRKPSQESFFALNAIPLYSYAIPLRSSPGGEGLARGASGSLEGSPAPPPGEAHIAFPQPREPFGYATQMPGTATFWNRCGRATAEAG